jgi:hypothetical protein
MPELEVCPESGDFLTAVLAIAEDYERYQPRDGPFAVRAHADEFSDVPDGRGSRFDAVRPGKRFHLQGCQNTRLAVSLIYDRRAELAWPSQTMCLSPAKARSPFSPQG